MASNTIHLDFPLDALDCVTDGKMINASLSDSEYNVISLVIQKPVFAAPFIANQYDKVRGLVDLDAKTLDKLQVTHAMVLAKIGDLPFKVDIRNPVKNGRIDVGIQQPGRYSKGTVPLWTKECGKTRDMTPKEVNDVLTSVKSASIDANIWVRYSEKMQSFEGGYWYTLRRLDA